MSKKKELRDSLNELNARKAFTKDENRPEATQKRKGKGFRTARENIADICDNGSFVEYGSLVLAAQRSRKSLEELQERTPADGLVMGLGDVNSDWFKKTQTKCVVLSYDYTVLAGTQGVFNHMKLDKILKVAKKMAYPVVFFTEGGGGRPGDTDFDLISVSGLNVPSFAEFARLSGKVPRIAIVNGYCFAGNAALAGCADVIIATKDSSLGMGGPAMIEGGNLGTFHPKEIGPANVQSTNGVIDILVNNEADAVIAAKQYLSYFQGDIAFKACANQEALRDVLPKDRRYAYDIHKLIDILADTNSVLELRAHFAKNMITAFIRIDGKPMGLIANDCRHLGGAIDGDASDKAARFMQLCDAFGIPILSLIDTPGFMVGPDHEKLGLVRHTSRMFVVGANIQVPLLAVAVRRGYGLGAMAMAGGGFDEPVFTVAWDTGEFGGMNLEGAVKLGFKKELESVPEGEAREKLYNDLLGKFYDQSKAINVASVLELDEVIDPKDTRKWIISILNSRPEIKGSGRFVDAY